MGCVYHSNSSRTGCTFISDPSRTGFLYHSSSSKTGCLYHTNLSRTVCMYQSKLSRMGCVYNSNSSRMGCVYYTNPFKTGVCIKPTRLGRVVSITTCPPGQSVQCPHHSNPFNMVCLNYSILFSDMFFVYSQLSSLSADSCNVSCTQRFLLYIVVDNMNAMFVNNTCV